MSFFVVEIIVSLAASIIAAKINLYFIFAVIIK
jgi:hypothetical protein